MGNLLSFGIPNTTKLIYRGYNTSNGNCYSGSASNNGIDVYKIDGKSVQDGTPTPDVPIEIQDLSISKFTSKGKNLIPPVATTTKNGITFTQTDNGICVDGTAMSSLSFIQLFKDEMLPSGTYSINGITGGSGNTYQVLVYLNGVNTHNIHYSNKTFVLTETTRVTLELYVYQNYGTFNNLILPYQLERGDVCTEYEAPKSATTTTNITLRSLPNGVCDTYENGVITRRVGVMTLDGSSDEDWRYDAGVFYFMTKNKILLCEYFESVEDKQISDNTIASNRLMDGQMCLRSDTPDRTYFKFTQYTSLEEFKAWLSSNPITVYYELATPTTETLDIPTLPSYYPTTNVYHDSLDTEIEWHVKLHGNDDKISVLETEIENVQSNVDKIQSTSSGRLEGVGWYRVAEYVSKTSDIAKGSATNSCNLTIKRMYSNDNVEYHELQLVSLYDDQSIKSLTSKCKLQLITKARYVIDETTFNAYLEIYYKGARGNGVTLILDNPLDYLQEWRAIKPILTEETVDGCTVSCTYDIPKNVSTLTTEDDYATQTSLNATQTSLNATNTNVSNIVNGTTQVGNALKATQDGNGATITSTYVNLSGTQTISGAKTFSGNAIMKTDTDYSTSRARNIALQGTTPTSIANGSIVGVYE